MLAYLDMLCTALLARNGEEILRLLEHPLAGALPRRVREEAMAMVQAGANSFMAPIHTLHFYHQTAHLLGAQSDPGSRPAQFELPLRAAGGSR